MLFSLGVMLGTVLGFGLLLVSLRATARAGAPPGPAWPRWTSVFLGASASAALALGVAGVIDTPAAIPVVLALPVAGAIFSAGRIAARDRSWQTWLGLALAAAPTLLMVAFVIGEILGPAH